MVNRGDIWWAALPDPVASEPGYKRPVIIIQSDTFNRSRIQTVIGVALTSNLRLAEAPGNVRLSARKTRLPKDSVANVSQIVTIDEVFLTDRCGHLDAETMLRIDAGIRLVLSL
ncbi:MAG: type II toxin-antitoxin system PemK/MazF family toxin [Burkholderiales bacterium]|nr:type II toxin-antitoxin system PemK/MazF family toxin [Burkholderiales bacterium]